MVLLNADFLKQAKKTCICLNPYPIGIPSHLKPPNQADQVFIQILVIDCLKQHEKASYV